MLWGALAVSPRRVGEPAPPRRDDGHADLASARSPPTCGRCGRCSSLGDAGMPGMKMTLQPAVRMAMARTASDLRGRRCRHHVHSRWPLFRGARQAPVRRARCAPCLSIGRQGRRRPAGRIERNRVPIEQLAVGDRLRGPARREGRDRRRRRVGHLGGRRVAADRRASARRGRSRRHGRRGDGQRRRAAAWSAPPGSAPTPQLAQIARLVDRGPERQGRACSGWPTGSRPSSCRSSSALAVATSASGCCIGGTRDRRVHAPPSPC